MPTVNYDFDPNVEVYVTNTDECCVHKGTVCQVMCDVYLNAMDVVEQRVEYLILLDGEEGTVTVSDSTVFATSTEALAVIQNKLDSP